MINHKKLIEVALPLEAINKASAREKSIRHGHPSTLAFVVGAAAVGGGAGGDLCADGGRSVGASGNFPTEKAQEKERQRLFRLIEELVQWENTTNERCLPKRATRSGRAGARPARRTRIIRVQQNYSTGQTSRVSRSFRRWRVDATGGAAARAGKLCQRSEPGGGADQQGDDRDPAEVRRASRR